jgi:Ca2+-binding RTX toxin-like protein
LAFTTTTGAGGTSLIGTSGVDTVALNAAVVTAPFYIGAQADNDVVSLITNAAQTGTIDLGAGNDIFTSTVTLGASTVRGNDGTDIINIGGNITASLINANADADLIEATADLTITQSSILGGQGDDILDITGADAGITFSGGRINGNSGNDSITVALAANMTTSGTNAATINGGQGNDIINQNGTFNAVISGDDGADRLTSSNGNDTIYGGAGADTINGGTNDGRGDTLVGGDGVDTFIGAGENIGRIVNVATEVDSAAFITPGLILSFGASGAVPGDSAVANSVDVITNFTAGAGGDVLALEAGPEGFTNEAINTQIGANPIKAISGTWSATAGTFTVSQNNTAGPDTLVLVGNGLGYTSASNGFVLSAVNASQVTLANL